MHFRRQHTALLFLFVVDHEYTNIFNRNIVLLKLVDAVPNIYIID